MKYNKIFVSLIFLLAGLTFFPFSAVLAQISDAELVNQQTEIIVKNDKLYINRSYEIQINNRLGEKYADISIPFSKLNKVFKIEAFIKDKEGNTVRNLKPKDITVRSEIADFSLYEDDFVKEFTLIHNIYPYRIFYSYQVQSETFLSLEDWTPIIDSDIPTLNATLTLEIPQEYKIAYKAQLIDKFSVDTLEETFKYCWKAFYKDQVESEIFSPDISNFIPNVTIVPDTFKFDLKGSFRSWESFGNWQYQLNEGLNDLPESEIEKIKSLVEGVKDEKEKIRMLYHYLQDATRYINVKIETGGMKPYPASYVAGNKYGDCKALSNYFKSVLHTVGVNSFYTKVYADEVIRKVDLNFPSQQSNHIILCIPVQHDTVWLDCTSDGPFNYLGTFTQHREVFLIEKDNSHFIRTPSLSKDDVLEIRNIRVSSDPANGIVADFHNTYRGKSFELLFDLSRSVSDSNKSLIIRNNLIETGFDLLNYKLITPPRDSAYIVFNYTAKAGKLFKNYGDEQLVRMIPFSVPPFTEPKRRKYPVQLNFPVYKIDTLEYPIPNGYIVSGIMKDQSINTPFGAYNIQFHQIGNTIQVIKSFLLMAGDYLPEQYPDFFNFVKKVSDIENNTYIITKKQS